MTRRLFLSTALTCVSSTRSFDGYTLTLALAIDRGFGGPAGCHCDPSRARTRPGQSRRISRTLVRIERLTLTPVEQDDVLVDPSRVLQLERQVEEFRSLFLTSKNLESRRRSVRGDGPFPRKVVR